VLVGELELTLPDPVIAEEAVQEDNGWPLAIHSIGDLEPVDLDRPDVTLWSSHGDLSNPSRIQKLFYEWLVRFLGAF
jgi:hypothetical protein